MRYGIYDTSLEVWVKTSWLEFKVDGIPVTENKSEALSSEDRSKVERALETLHHIWKNNKGNERMTSSMEVREL